MNQPRPLPKIGEVVRLAYTRTWLGPVVNIKGEKSGVRYPDGQVRWHRSTLLFTEPQTTEYD